MSGTHTQTGEKNGLSVETRDDDAVSADPVARERFRRGVCFDCARRQGWPLEHAVVEYDSKILLPEEKEYVSPRAQ